MFKGSTNVLPDFFMSGDFLKKSLKERYITSAIILLAATVIVKIISAVYKIPLTNYIGATGRGYFSVAYNFCMPFHALAMGAFPLALTRLVSSYEAKGDRLRIKALRKAAKKLFFIVGIIGLGIILITAKPYANFIASSPKSIYTILALAPSIFFSCLCACHRAFAEGFLDMKATAISQTIEALCKMIFGLLFARFSMSWLYGFYIENGTVFGIGVMNDEEALSVIYPITSACAMLGVTIGSIAGYIFAGVYAKIKYYNILPKDKVNSKSAYSELLTFSAGLVGATVVQSLANFADTSSIQYCLSLCDPNVLSAQYGLESSDIYTYVFGIYAVALDFKNLVPAAVMALGVSAVPAVSTAFENGQERFSSLLTSIFKYTVIMSVGGGAAICLFYNDLLSIFYSGSNEDIVQNAGRLLFLFGMTSLPCAAASTSVYCAQALGYSKQTIVPFAVSAVVRVILNFILITNGNINILGSSISNFIGYLIILVWNMIIIHKKTKAKFSLLEIFIKPVACAALAYFSTSSIRESISSSMSDILVFILSATVCLLSFGVLLILMNCVSLKEIKSIK